MALEERADGLYEYNPVTDQYVRVGPKPLSREEQISNAAQSAQREAEAKLQESKFRAEHRRDAGFAASSETLRELAAERKEKETLVAGQRDRDRAERARENTERNHAINAAYKRYEQQSRLYKFFHKSINKVDFDKMSIEEINGLYPGKSR